jgi:molybdopterin molybdotransferase
VADLLSYEEALATVLAACRPVGTERIALSAASGRVLAVAPRVTSPLPPFANSAMDGFALRATDVPSGGGSLPLDPAVPAGTDPPPLRPGFAAPIATGGPIPRGADTIVPIEDATRADGHVVVPGGLTPGAYIRLAGSDIPTGPSPLTPGDPLDPAAGAVLAAIGAIEVDVFRRPRVTVLATGSELVPPDATPGPAQIRDANSTALGWAHTHAGAEVRHLGIAADDAQKLRALLRDALDADLVVTCAGVSVGERDLVRATLAELGVVPRFWGIDLKPGKPVAFGIAGTVPVISLPGNPASALVCSTLIAEPATRARAGRRAPAPRWEHATAGVGWPAAEGRMHAVRCGLDLAPEHPIATPTGDQRSHRIGSMVGATTLALIESHRLVAPGEGVRITRMGEGQS